MVSTAFYLALMGFAFVVTTLVYPYVLRFAVKHRVVDNPCARKLQRVPVPVMGGTAIFIGLTLTAGICYAVVPDPVLVQTWFLLLVMYAIGVWDDVKDVSAAFRFLAESVIVWLMIWLLDVRINDFHGLWGIRQIPDVVSVPLSIVAGVGIMNAVNLIDGVDGYCSAYGMVTCGGFAVFFFYADDMAMFSLALITIGALAPFFLHNVFGRTSKMFLGDGGSLMLGTLLTLFTLRLLSGNSLNAQYGYMGLSLPAMALALLSVPVFDTLKVMIFRVVRGVSPFSPDKTHLHHLFIEMNFSHLATALLIVSVNVLIVVALVAAWLLGMPIDQQVYLVVLLSLLFTCVFYFLMERERRKRNGEGSRFWVKCCQRGKSTNLSATPLWQLLRRIMDSRLLGAGLAKDPPAVDPGPDEADQT